jgi:paraquat-inducible protein B
MSDPPAGTPAAVVTRRHFSWIWLIPVASLAIGGWLLWTTVSRRGPMIDISFATAEGLLAGQSQVKYKDIQMGTVESFDLAPDRSKVVMHIRMTSKATSLLTEGTQFWVVKPRLFAGDITGLNTVISGSYIEMMPGAADAAAVRDFAGLENPPAVDPDQPGRLFHLKTARIGALSVGSPVFYHDIEVGKVQDWQLTTMAEEATLNVFINAPYDQWVHDNSRFWNTSGVSLKLDSDGFRLEVNSIKAALLGGITFETPQNDQSGGPSDAEHTFQLFPSENIAEAATDPQHIVMATYLTGSAGGLGPGSPVMFMGLRVGEVTAVDLQFDPATNQGRVRVDFDLEVDRVHAVGGAPAPGSRPAPEDGLRAMVRSGLRASLKGGNIVTGQKQLALEFEPDAAAADLGRDGDIWVIPSTGGGNGLDDITASLNAIMAKIEKMPLEQIGQNLNQTLHGAGAALNSPELTQALARLNATLRTVQSLVQHIDAGATPALKRLPAVVDDLQATLAQVRSLAASVSAGSAGDGKFGRDLDRLLAQVTDAAEQVRMVADLLARHPEALVRGRVGRN